MVVSLFGEGGVKGRGDTCVVAVGEGGGGVPLVEVGQEDAFGCSSRSGWGRTCGR
jgi:hypothetical protein